MSFTTTVCKIKSLFDYIHLDAWGCALKCNINMEVVG